MRLATLGLLGFIVAPVAAGEADDLQAEVIKCGGIEDSRKRIACYDRIAQSAASAAEESHPPPKAHDETPLREEAVLPTLVERRPTLPVVAEPAPREATAAPLAAPDAVDAFGAEKLRHSGGEAIDRVVAEIAVVRKLSRGNFQLALNNGQTWREIEYDKYTRYAVGDTVEIRRGRLGTYDLVSRETGHRNKVRRIE